MRTIFLMVLVTCMSVVGCAKEQSERAAEMDGAQPEVGGSSDAALRQGKRGEEGDEVARVSAAEVIAAPHPGLLALSEEEAAWLDRHGYPTPGELEALHSFDTAELEDGTRNRADMKSAALLGHKRAAAGDLGGALAAFSRGANLGSLYARQQYALHSAQRATDLPIEQLADADQGNLGILMAQLEVARLLGDHRAKALIDRYGQNFFWDVYGKQVFSQVAIFMDQYGEYARSQGKQAHGPDPRPNQDKWANLQEDPNAIVEVYTRGGTSP